VSQENLDKAMGFIAAYNRRDFDAAVEFFDPDIEWVLPAHQSSDSCQGPRAIKRFWRGLDETFEELRLDPQEAVDAGDRVAIRLRYYLRGKGSGVEMESELYHQVATFRDGMMVRIEYFTSWPEALAAAQLRAEPGPVEGSFARGQDESPARERRSSTSMSRSPGTTR
jgi:ketosteroid isomerase-like protein